ncbi:MAG: DNA-3-methyladenine glycosylase I, partial [Candidatus Thermoplasmatota archaeon]|nr:DNA-3-methyladenine glycosylase I [Candidatus Thermoplasmatota archaeon]MBU1940664.1 DNA-3-methyladenine glycosylase I [Candidatus Thermoplasmatota archaeon]
MKRCPWCEHNKLYLHYHDEEWGVPIHDDTTHLEFLILEGAQAGLSWLTILKKRPNYRKVYDNFNPHKIAQYNENKIQELMNNPGIIRNKAKIKASINTAQKFLTIQHEYGSFDTYLWQYVDNKPINNTWKKDTEIP